MLVSIIIRSAYQGPMVFRLLFLSLFCELIRDTLTSIKRFAHIVTDGKNGMPPTIRRGDFYLGKHVEKSS